MTSSLLRSIALGVTLALSACSKPLQLTDIPAATADVDCSHAQPLNVASDPSTPGPWAVGAQTATLHDDDGQSLTTEIWYPAAVGAAQGKTPITYDLHQFLSPGDAAKLSDQALSQACDCYASLPLDTQNGPYPVILLLHGSGSFRTASLSLAVHWASRGFVVMAADYPALQLKDFKTNPLNALFHSQAR
ncbi:MAG TPA: hypothetical protein VFM46_14905, partial [Pseudomonadales bacterium]|nr:hypothetical protein [Pseudomonadales bacterium]